MIQVSRTDLKTVLPFRNLFLQENNCQIRYNAYHERGWADYYLFRNNETIVGYGTVKGKDNRHDRDTIFECYVIPPVRAQSALFFTELIRVSGTTFIECQSNDLILSSLLYQYAQNIHSDVILFEDRAPSHLVAGSCIFRARKENDFVFEHTTEPVGEYVLELDGTIIATGGFLLHYNMPFADLYMEVAPGFRGKGFGSFLIQELKQQCYRSGRVPAARCNIDNTASKGTLLKAGFGIAGFMLLGAIKS